MRHPGRCNPTGSKARLDEAGDACILAFYHKPAYSLVERRDRAKAIDLFRQLHQGSATVVLNGHNHFYERTMLLDGSGVAASKSGTVAFTVGTGGRIDNAQPEIETTADAVFGHTGLLRLDLANGEYS